MSSRYNRCPCGKAELTEAESQYILRTKSSKGFKRSYICPQSDTYHVTSKPQKSYKYPFMVNSRKFNTSRLEEELHSNMAAKTVKQLIQEYMEDKYTSEGVTKFYTGDIIDEVLRIRPTVNRGTVAADISQLKKRGIVVSTKEKVADVPGAVYVTLSAIRDAQITPVKEEVKPVAEKTTTVAIPTNPIAGIQKELEVVNTRLSGISKGYAEISETLNGIRYSVDLTKESKPTDASEISDAINSRLRDLQSPNSLIYAIRDEIQDAFNSDLMPRLGRIEGAINKAVTSPGSEDYKQGLRDGIKMAAEMGLFIPDGN